MTTTNTHHVTIDDRGVAWIDDTNVPDPPGKAKLRAQGLI